MRARSVIIAASVYACAHAASAQSVTVAVTHDNGGSVVEMGRTVTWQLAVLLEGFETLTPDPVVESVNIRLDPTDPAFAAYADFQYVLDANGGTSGGANADGVINFGFTNSLLLEQAGAGDADRSTPLVVASWTTTVQDMGPFEYTLALGPSTGPLVRVATSPFTGQNFSTQDVTFESDRLFVPAPASALLLAPVTLLARRRRD
ncbi:MAG: hypothetical protein ACF8Q5_00805 [Phycisphaerales bacterium JB040]